MNMDLNLNPADFQLCDGFGFYKLCLTLIISFVKLIFRVFVAVE